MGCIPSTSVLDVYTLRLKYWQKDVRAHAPNTTFINSSYTDFITKGLVDKREIKVAHEIYTYHHEHEKIIKNLLNSSNTDFIVKCWLLKFYDYHYINKRTCEYCISHIAQ